MTTAMELNVSPADSFLNSATDIDAHEMIPLHMWPDVFGEAALNFTTVCSDLSLVDNLAENTLRRDDLTSDEMLINVDTVWGTRGPSAPSAIDLGRRAEVLDVMGVSRQLLFPNFALIGVMLACHPQAHRWFAFDPTKVDRHALGREVVTAHNDWVVRTIRELKDDRVRPVAVVMTGSLDEMMLEGERLIASGVRGVMIPCGIPPGGLSPANTKLDPFWSMFEEANVPVLLHIGTEFPFLASSEWAAGVPEFKRSANSSLEFPVEPFYGVTLNFAHENFLAAMVLGGVFERHPMLRFGCIEVGAQWMGPLADRLQLWFDQFSTRFTKSLSMQPAEYLSRNVRVGPFVFEDTASYFERYPQLSSLYCFSSDYPHREGGRNAKQRFYDNLAPLGEDIVKKFFVENGEWLLPA
jgi:predicted TIM-barrel fold metal-dependent hydrolase